MYSCITVFLYSCIHVFLYSWSCRFYFVFLYCCIILESDVPGLNDEDLEASVATLKSMAETLNAECTMLRKRQEKAGHIEEYLMRKRAEETDFMEVRYVLYSYRLYSDLL